MQPTNTAGFLGLRCHRWADTFEEDMKKNTRSLTNHTGIRYYEMEDLNEAKGFLNRIGAWFIKTFGTQVHFSGRTQIIGKRSFKEFVSRVSTNMTKEEVTSVISHPGVQNVLSQRLVDKINELAKKNVKEPLKHLSIQECLDTVYALRIRQNQLKNKFI